jgi:hypothetical protein
MLIVGGYGQHQVLHCPEKIIRELSWESVICILVSQTSWEGQDERCFNLKGAAIYNLGIIKHTVEYNESLAYLQMRKHLTSMT